MTDKISSNQHAVCLICGSTLSIRVARGRKSGKPFVMLICQQDGRHFRAFINHEPYVRQLLDRFEERKGAGQPE